MAYTRRKDLGRSSPHGLVIPSSSSQPLNSAVEFAVSLAASGSSYSFDVGRLVELAGLYDEVRTHDQPQDGKALGLEIPANLLGLADELATSGRFRPGRRPRTSPACARPSPVT